MKQNMYIKDTSDETEVINIQDLNFHPVIKDIENIFWLFLLSNKALSLPETQGTLSLDNNFSQMLKKYNDWTGLKVKRDPTKSSAYTTNLNAQGQMILLGKAMAIITYDFVDASEYNSKLNKDNAIQFLRYIRNGAAHYNKFNMKDEEGNWKIGENEVIEWRNKRISRGLHNKRVFPDFFNIFSMFLLAKEISEKLIKIDKK